MTILLIITLIILGILLLFIEFTILPGITIAGIGAFALFAYSVFMAYVDYGLWAAVGTAIFILILAPILILKFFKTKAGKKMQLDTQIKGTVGEIIDVKEGDHGVTEGRLAPVGKVRIGNNTYEAKSIDGLIDENVDIKVIEVHKTQILVDLL